MWFRFKRITQNLDEVTSSLWHNGGTKMASTQLFMEDCPGVNALCFKGIVVWLGQEQLGRPSPTEGRKRRCLISSGALQMGISGLSPQFRPTLLVFYDYLMNDQNLVTYSSAHMYSLLVSVGQESGQCCRFFFITASQQAAGSCWIHLSGSSRKEVASRLPPLPAEVNAWLPQSSRQLSSFKPANCGG